MSKVTTVRLNVMRVFYGLLAVERGYRALPALVGPDAPLGPFDGVAYSFWGALALLAALGVRYPLQMLPVLLIFLVYKILWLLGVALPLWLAGQPFDPAMTQFTWAMGIGAGLDLVVIPWGYVFANYVRKPADRSTTESSSQQTTPPISGSRA